MADNYIEYIANGLKELHPQLSSQGFIDYWDNNGGFFLNGGNEWVEWSWDDFFKAIAWQGLESDPDNEKYKIAAWDELSQQQKDVMNDYQRNNYESNKCN